MIKTEEMQELQVNQVLFAADSLSQVIEQDKRIEKAKRLAKAERDNVKTQRTENLALKA